SSLAHGTTKYQTTAGETREPPPWPETVNGLRAEYMEKAGKKFFVVRLMFEESDVVLGNPLALDRLRHLGNRRLSPAPTVLDDALASTLLDDVIEANPDQNAHIALLINRINQ